MPYFNFDPQLRTNDAKLAREVISLIDCDSCVFEDHAALAFEIFADPTAFPPEVDELADMRRQMKRESVR